MADADYSLPKFKTYAEGEPIPPVDPEDIKRWWEYERTHTKVNSVGWQWLQGLKAALSPEAEFSDVSSRHRMIRTLITYKLLAPWQHSETLDDAVFRIAATFPLREHKHQDYMIAGDERFGFDPNAFVQKLIEETGISHVWEPIAISVREGGRTFCFFTIPNHDPERHAKRETRAVTWMIWKRFSPMSRALSKDLDKETTSQMVATSFANYLLDNIDLVRQLEDAFRDVQHVPLDPILSQLERRAQSFFPGSE